MSAPYIEGEVGFNAPAARRSFDREMDLPEYEDPKIKAEIEAMERNQRTPSGGQNQEFVEQEYAKNYAARRDFRWQGQARWQGRENEEMRLRRFMHPYTVFAHLRRAGVDARLEKHQNARLWLNDYSRAGLIGVNARVLGPTGWEEKMIISLQYPYGPEWSVMAFDEYDVPTKERWRGWRTVMLALIREQVVTEAQVDKAFGPVVLNRASEFYRQQLQSYRSLRMGLTV